jgi:hypothetical protein
MYFSECTINTSSELSDMSPLIISKDREELDGTNFLLPTVTSPIASLYNGEEVAILCPGNNNRLSVSNTTGQLKEVTITCDSGTQVDD